MSNDRFVDGPPSGADGWREVWQEDRRYRVRASRYEWFLRAARRLVRRANEQDDERQKNFNLTLLDLIADLRRDLDAVRRDSRGDVDKLAADVRAADEALAADVARVVELLPVAVRRNDALFAALDQKIETLAVRLRDVTTPLLRSAGVPRPPREAGETPALLHDVLYRRLEDGLRGSAAEVEEAMRPYVELARGQQPAIDAGCGRGEFLVLCRDAGIAARGFDVNERSVADLQSRGFDVEQKAIPECFAAIDDGTVGSILAVHVVEHLPVDALFAMFAEAARVLRGGGLLMIETPNAESLAVSASEFWRDPTHLAPRHPAALTLLAREHGFAIDEIRAVHPFPEGVRLAVSDDDGPGLRRVVDAINERLFGPQDLRLILRRA